LVAAGDITETITDREVTTTDITDADTDTDNTNTDTNTDANTDAYMDTNTDANTDTATDSTEIYYNIDGILASMRQVCIICPCPNSSMQLVQQNRQRRFLVKWSNFPLDQASWDSEKDVTVPVLRYNSTVCLYTSHSTL